MLEGELVRLRALRRDDLPTIVEHYNDPDVVAYMQWWLRPMGPADAEAFYEQAIKVTGETATLAIARLADDAFLGSMGFVHVDWRSRSGEFGIAIWNPEGRGRGYGTQAVRLFCDWGFGVLNLNRIELRTYDYNARALRCYEKAGFVQEGRKRQARYWDGAYHDEIVMGLLREEWERQA